MIAQAETQSAQYTEEVNSSVDFGFTGGELGDMLNQNSIQPQYKASVENLRIPQFYLETAPDLFGEQYELLEKENLSEGFSLVGQDATINFELSTGEMYRVDLQDAGEAVPKYKKASSDEAEFIRNYLKQFPEEKRKQICINNICDIISKNNRLPASEIRDYVNRCLANLTEDQMNALETSYPAYAKKIINKIETLEGIYRKRLFYKWLDSGKIVCRNSYELPAVITPQSIIDSIPFSLYEAESNKMNDFERRVLDIIVGFDNIEFWHRVIEKRDFRLNGFINHYPDFLVKTKKGNIVFVESKGDVYDGSDSMARLELGREWQSRCPEHLYSYFMVFENKNIDERGAYTIDEFVSIFKNL